MSGYSRWQGGPAHLLERSYFQQAMTLLAAREATVKQITSVPDVEARRDHVQALFRDTVFGPLDLERTPLNPRVTRTFHDERGFTPVKILRCIF